VAILLACVHSSVGFGTTCLTIRGFALGSSDLAGLAIEGLGFYLAYVSSVLACIARMVFYISRTSLFACG
jgi:hypothetical protein